MDVTIPCICPPKADGQARHPDGDTITLREHLDFRAAVTARNSIVLLKQDDPEATSADILALLTETELLVGISAWTITDAKGVRLEVTRTNIREVLLSHADEAMIAGDAADELYTASVLLPLLAKASTFSPPMPIADSTSATTTSSRTNPTRSKRSSITTIPTGATETTSPSLAGASSS